MNFAKFAFCGSRGLIGLLENPVTYELIIEDGGQRQHREKLSELLETTTGPVRVATAYVTDDDLLFGLKGRKVQLLTSLSRMDIVIGATKLDPLRSLIKSKVKCRCLSHGPRFHAKVYIFGDECAVVTSANLTTNAFESNIEAGVHVAGKRVQELIKWYETFWNKADDLEIGDLLKWAKETDELRRAYAALRKKARKKLPLPKESVPSVQSHPELADLFDHDAGYFLCNTNRRNSRPRRQDESLMRVKKRAVAWVDFNYPSHMERVKKGDTIFMFAKGVGIIGVGRAKSKCEIVQPGKSGSITGEVLSVQEWHVPVDEWVVWTESDEDAVEWKDVPNGSFVDIGGDSYQDIREKVRKRFLGE